MTSYNIPGHECAKTGRICMTVAEAYSREDSCERTFFAYSIEAESLGLECWRQVEGIDASTQVGVDGSPISYTLDWLNGGASGELPPRMPIYMQRSKSERAAAIAKATGSAE